MGYEGGEWGVGRRRGERWFVEWKNKGRLFISIQLFLSLPLAAPYRNLILSTQRLKLALPPNSLMAKLAAIRHKAHRGGSANQIRPNSP